MQTILIDGFCRIFASLVTHLIPKLADELSIAPICLLRKMSSSLL